MATPSLKIALIGTRGVPANYSGFETCVEEVGKRLASRGHRVTVYCRRSYYEDNPDSYCGMRRVSLPNLRHRSLDTMSHTFLSTWHALFEGYDVYMVFNAANSLFVAPLRLFGKKLAINTDGLEWKRSKWGFLGKNFYRISEKLACLVATRLVSDSEGIRQYYLKEHGTDSTEIAYGAYLQTSDATRHLERMGVEPGGYFLQITRFEPENHPLLTVRAFNRLNTDKKLVLVGGNPYPTEYTRAIASEAGPGVLLPGRIYDKEILRELWCHAYTYIHGNSVGGTNPALLQTMASGCPVLAVDVTFNREVLQDCGDYYDPDESALAQKMMWALENAGELRRFSLKASARIEKYYSWDRIADKYERLFIDLHEGRCPPSNS